jgi:hypothetical protein
VWAPKSVWTVVGEKSLATAGHRPGFLGHAARNLVTKPTPVDLCDKTWLYFAKYLFGLLTVVQFLKKFYAFCGT